MGFNSAPGMGNKPPSLSQEQISEIDALLKGREWMGITGEKLYQSDGKTPLPDGGVVRNQVPFRYNYHNNIIAISDSLGQLHVAPYSSGLLEKIQKLRGLDYVSGMGVPAIGNGVVLGADSAMKQWGEKVEYSAQLERGKDVK